RTPNTSPCSAAAKTGLASISSNPLTSATLKRKLAASLKCGHSRNNHLALSPAKPSALSCPLPPLSAGPLMIGNQPTILKRAIPDSTVGLLTYRPLRCPQAHKSPSPSDGRISGKG